MRAICAALLIILLPSSGAAIELKSIIQITTNINVQQKSTYYFSSGAKTDISNVKSFIQLEPVTIEGENFWSVYGAPSDGCNIDSRFSLVMPLFKIGKRKNVDRVACSDPSRQESGTIVTEAAGGLSVNTLSVTSKLTINKTVLGVRYKEVISMSQKIDLSNGCRVISVSFSDEEKTDVNHDVTRLVSFDKECIIASR